MRAFSCPDWAAAIITCQSAGDCDSEPKASSLAVVRPTLPHLPSRPISAFTGSAFLTAGFANSSLPKARLFFITPLSRPLASRTNSAPCGFATSSGMPAAANARRLAYARCPEAFSTNTGCSFDTASSSAKPIDAGPACSEGSKLRPMIHCPGGVVLAFVFRCSSTSAVVAKRVMPTWSIRLSTKAPATTWACGSTKPGSMTRPRRSTTWACAPAAARTAASLPTATIRLPRIAMASACEKRRSTVRTVPPVNTVAAAPCARAMAGQAPAAATAPVSSVRRRSGGACCAASPADSQFAAKSDPKAPLQQKHS